MGLEEKGREASPEIQAQPQGTRPTRGSGRGSSVALGSQTKQLQIGVTGQKQSQNDLVTHQGAWPTRSVSDPIVGSAHLFRPRCRWLQRGVPASPPSCTTTGSSLKEG